jgi:hypothetical protein
MGLLGVNVRGTPMGGDAGGESGRVDGGLEE